MAPLARLQAAFLPELPARRLQRLLAGVDLAGRHLVEMPAQRVAELAHQHDAGRVGHRHYHRRARVPDVLAARGPAVGQPHLVFQDVQQLAAIYRLRGQSRFREIVDFVGHDRALNLAGGAPARG